MNGPEVAVAFMVFGGGFWVLRPLASALAKRISGEVPARRDPGTDEAMLVELQTLREDVDQLAERLDFAERLLAHQRDAQRISSGARDAS
jgi:hypothetical protein